MGWTNSSGRPCLRMPSASTCAARATSPGDEPVRAAAWRSSTRMPRIATAWASRVASTPARASRSAISRRIVGGVRTPALVTSAAVGDMPCSRHIAAKSWSRNGLPPVTSMTRPGEFHRRRDGERLTDERAGRGLAQWCRMERVHQRMRLEPREVVQLHLVIRPDTQHHQDGHPLEAPHEVPHPAGRSSIRPLVVVDESPAVGRWRGSRPASRGRA